MSESIRRREFLKSLGRVLLLAGIGALAVKLLGWRGARLLGGGRGGRSAGGRPGETCVNQWICRGCPAFSGCGLPQALSARRRAPWARLQGGEP